MRQWIRAHLTYANVTVTVILFIVLGGTALAASGSFVTITDRQHNDVARVNSKGALKVTGSGPSAPGGGAGPAIQDYLHSGVTRVFPADGCVEVYRPPKGQAMVVTQVRVNSFTGVYQYPAGTIQPPRLAQIFVGDRCLKEFQIGEASASGQGPAVIPFDPGFVVPDGNQIYAEATEEGVAVSVDGYAIPSSQSP
jgi:hypothetical protein